VLFDFLFLFLLDLTCSSPFYWLPPGRYSLPPGFGLGRCSSSLRVFAASKEFSSGSFFAFVAGSVFSPDLPARLGSVSRLKFQFFVAISVHDFFRRVRHSRLDFRFSLQVRWGPCLLFVRNVSRAVCSCFGFPSFGVAALGFPLGSAPFRAWWLRSAQGVPPDCRARRSSPSMRRVCFDFFPGLDPDSAVWLVPLAARGTCQVSIKFRSTPKASTFASKSSCAKVSFFARVASCFPFGLIPESSD
jgi:hypothetical protein